LPRHRAVARARRVSQGAILRRMRPDFYTKAVLTVIAFMLTLIACRTVVRPETTASAQGPFAGVQLSFNGTTFTAFDSRTGDIWYYEYTDGAVLPEYAGFHVVHMGKLGKLGELPAGAPQTIQLGEKSEKK